MRLWLLFRIEFLRGLWNMRRYPFETVTGVLSLGLIFFLLLGAGRVVTGVSPSPEGVTNLILTYTLGFVVLGEVSGIAQTIWQEAKSGMLKHLYLSGHRLEWVFIMRSLANLLVTLVTMGLLMLALGVMTRASIVWSMAMIPPLLLTIVGALGVGFVFAGIALLFKSISNLFSVFQLAFFGLTAAAAPQSWLTYLLPIAPGAGLVRAAALGAGLQMEQLLMLAANAVLYLGVGIIVFRWAERQAQQRGLIGHE